MIRCRSRCSRRHGLSAQIGDATDAAAGRDDVRVVRVEDGEAGRRHGPAGERASAGDGLGKRVGQDEGEVGPAVTNQLEVVDRCGRDLGRGADVAPEASR